MWAAFDLIISAEEVEWILGQLNINKATDPDGVHAWILRDSAPLLAGPLCVICSSSVHEGYVPALFKYSS